jgi:sister chromatid cohesion protein DCC1
MILELLLNLLVALSLSHDAASVEELTSTLADEHEIPRQISTQVMSWFGHLHDGKWKMDVDGVMREIGLGILRQYKVAVALYCSCLSFLTNLFDKSQNNPIAKDEFIAKWKSSAGDTFESAVSLGLLSVS